MACILKLPKGGAKGVLTFTTPERDLFINRSPDLKALIYKIKADWIIGLHHNSAHADHNFAPDPVFDFHIAGPGDLLDPQGREFIQIEMDCSNFCPDFFENNRHEQDKFWDILFIARNSGFKSLDDLIAVVRKLFDTEKKRVLAIIPHVGLHEKGTGPSEIINNYLQTFNSEERKYFTLLTPSIDTPFPFDLETLAHFYHSSRIFLHVARAERHPRVVAYAWAAGLPVVAPPQVAALLPEQLKCEPGFYGYASLDDAVSKIRQALDSHPGNEEMAPYIAHHLQSFSTPRLKEEIKKVYAITGHRFIEEGWILNGLDIRLARHHLEKKDGNSIGQATPEFVLLLCALCDDKNMKLPDITSGDYEVAVSEIKYDADPGRIRQINKQIHRNALRNNVRVMYRNLWGRVMGYARTLMNRLLGNSAGRRNQ